MPSPKDADDVIPIKNPKVIIAVNLDPKNQTQGKGKGKVSIGTNLDIAVEASTETPGKFQPTKAQKFEENHAAKAAQVISTQKQCEHKVTLTKLGVIDTQAPPEDVLAAIMADMQGWQGLEKDKSQQKFNKHVCTYFQYLRAVHTAPTTSIHAEAVVRLQDYVYAKSCSKMLARFASGAKITRDGHKVNFWEVLTTYTKVMPEHASNIPMPAHLATKTPDESQGMLIRSVFSKHTYVNQLATTTPIYSVPSERVRFQVMLQTYLARAKSGIAKLVQVMKDLEEKDGIASSNSASDVTTALRNGRRGVVMLLDFLNAFEEFLEPHLEWLAQCANVVDFKDKPTWSLPYAKTPSQRAPAQTEFPDAVQNEAESSEDEDEDDFTQTQASAMQESRDSPYKSCAVAARSFLRLPCLHEVCLRQATAAVPGNKTDRQNYESALIQQAQISVVNLEMKSRDREIARIDTTFIEKLGRHAGFTGPSQLRADFLIQNLSDKDKIHVGKPIQHSSLPNISGSSHCESILMSLIAIAKDKNIMGHINDNWLRHNGIFVTASDLLNEFGGLVNWVLGSKKACSPRGQTKASCITEADFIAPGFRKKWSGVLLLPAILPKKLGKPVLDSTMLETAKKLYEFQRILDIANEVKVRQDESPQSEEHLMPAELKVVNIEDHEELGLDEGHAMQAVADE